MADNRVLQFWDRYFPPGVRVWVTQSRYVVCRFTSSGWLLVGRCLPFVSQDYEGQTSEVWATIWEDIMKKKDLSKSVTASQHADPVGLSKHFPRLAEFMTAAVYEGSKERRESPTVTIWCTSGTWRASVKDRAEGLVLWLSAPKVEELLLMLDTFVLAADAPWRHDDTNHERNGKRVKKGS